MSIMSTTRKFSMFILVIFFNIKTCRNFHEPADTYSYEADEIYNDEQSENDEPEPITHFQETTGVRQSLIYTESTIKFDNDALKKHWFKMHNTSSVSKIYTLKKKRVFSNSEDKTIARRSQKARNSNLSQSGPISCLQCANYDDRTDSDSSKDPCVTGVNLQPEKCKAHELCYTEVKPKSVKRGCVEPTKLNRTFACKCSLCNNKPYNATLHYNADEDWRYDNAQIQQVFLKEKTSCKVCETKGVDDTKDEICRDGAKARNVICDPGQICAVNIIEATKYVRRSCVKKPIYNSLWHFCETDSCNDMEVKSKVYTLDKKLKSSNLRLRENRSGRGNRICVKTSVLAFIIMFRLWK